MKGRLYGVGVGPGDPSLLTLKAVEIMKKADVIAFPASGGEKTACRIAAPYIEGKPLLECPLPMTRDTDVLRESREKSVAMLCAELERGKTVVFITLGDPTIYSTYSYLHKAVRGQGYEAAFVPGVPSFCAVAAELETPLCEAGEPLHILPASYAGMEDSLSLPGSKVLMKVGRKLPEVKQALRKKGLEKSAQMASCCGMEGERLYARLDDADEAASYFSIILVKEEL